jgi:aconitate hydratase
MEFSLRTACLRELQPGTGSKASFYSLPALQQSGLQGISRLPVSLRIVLESLLRNCDGQVITEQHVRDLAQWKPQGERSGEIPFFMGRVALNDTAGIPVLGDLAAMRSAAVRAGAPAQAVAPRVPVNMVMDHSLEVEFHARPDALKKNMELEMRRNEERFSFVKWSIQAFRGIQAIPPGLGILHQVNLEYLAQLVLCKDGVYFPETVIGPDSHTGMIAGLGVVGWGAGGIEVAAAMLGQPVYFLTPDVVGVHMSGQPAAGVTATDLVLALTATLRKARVAGKFVEFFGDGAARLSMADRATLANMSPEYGARLGFFPVDEKTCLYLGETGRSPVQVEAIRTYYTAQGCFGMPVAGAIDYTQVIPFDLGAIVPSVAGPKRPQDAVPLNDIKRRFAEVLRLPAADGGYARNAQPAVTGMAGSATAHSVRDGDIVIASITSCANTSNPGSMLTAGLLARRAVELGLRSKPWVKTSLAPGSAVVSRYLEAAGLQQYLDALGFNVVGYGCATCVGNSGPIDSRIEEAIAANNVIACAVLSGNRNFEGRTHPAVRATYLMSPALVVAFALAGTVSYDPVLEPLGHTAGGKPVFLRDLWPDTDAVMSAVTAAAQRDDCRAVYGMDHSKINEWWNTVPEVTGAVYPWTSASTYFREPPFFTDADLAVSSLQPVTGARALAILGNSITTDHISPISDIGLHTPAGEYLRASGVERRNFSSYGARRMNYEVLTRGVFANPHLRNLMLPGSAGGFTSYQPDAERTTIFDAAMRYRRERTPLVVFAGEEYGTGSARDWAAKGPRLLGVRAIIARSFERIHRSNLVGMGVLPCQFEAGTSAESLALDGSETFDIAGFDQPAAPRQSLELIVHRKNGQRVTVKLTLRVETEQEIKYLRCGGLLQYVLKEVLSADSIDAVRA